MEERQVETFYRNLPRLETPRVVLRQATRDDVPDVFAYSSDPRVTRYLRWGPHHNLSETDSYIRGVLDEYRSGRDGPWLIEMKPGQKVIGHIHLMNPSQQHRKAQVGFVLARSFWNKGIMTEALHAVLAYSFAELGLHRVEGMCVSENIAAIRVLEKVGMKREGVLRDYLYQKGAFCDFDMHAILRDEFAKTSADPTRASNRVQPAQRPSATGVPTEDGAPKL